jgi:hypothetical protein
VRSFLVLIPLFLTEPLLISISAERGDLACCFALTLLLGFDMGLKIVNGTFASAAGTTAVAIVDDDDDEGWVETEEGAAVVAVGSPSCDADGLAEGFRDKTGILGMNESRRRSLLLIDFKAGSSTSSADRLPAMEVASAVKLLLISTEGASSSPAAVTSVPTFSGCGDGSLCL